MLDGEPRSRDVDEKIYGRLPIFSLSASMALNIFQGPSLDRAL